MAEFDELRAQIPIERVFTEMLGVTDFRRSGSKQMIGTCPACGTKSLKITSAMGLSNCFNCPMGGNIIQAVSRARKLSLADAGNAIRRAPPVATGPMLRISVSAGRRVYWRETRAQIRGCGSKDPPFGPSLQFSREVAGP
jgi:hypothetical protein